MTAPEKTNIVVYWQNQVKKYRNRPAYRVKINGDWKIRSWTQYGERVRKFALGLLSLGVNPSDRVAILGSTREEWDLADRAALAIGGVGVGIYHSSTAEQVHYILEHAEAKIVVLENQEQWEKMDQIRSTLQAIEFFILMDPVAGASDPKVMSFTDVMRLGENNEKSFLETYRNRGKTIQMSDPAICVYTSGTTGPPKGAILSHGNIMEILESFMQMGLFVPEKDRTVVWLPLPHVFGRFVILSGIHNAHIWSYASSAESLLEDLAHIKPTLFHSVPRIYEKIYHRMISQVEQAAPRKRKLFDFCVKTGMEVSRRKQSNEPVPFLLKSKYAIADRILFRNLRNIFGRSIHTAVTGGAPLSPEILEFFHAAGILILEGYGLTESPVATFNRPDNFKFGTVGMAVPGMEIRIADDGEILLRSPIVFHGYLKAPDKTRASFLEDGWYCTGDIGVLDPDGFLTITDRKKDIIITAGGKNVAPQNIENLLKTSPFISQVMVFGDRKPFLTALITLDPEEVKPWCESRGIKADSFAQLCQDPRLVEKIDVIVKEKNRHLARYETIKKFTILPQEFTVEAGEITPTLKVKRRVICSTYRELLEKMYVTIDSSATVSE